MEQFKEFLQVSAQLYKHLTVIPDSEDRTEYIKKINELLDMREVSVNGLKQAGFEYNLSNKSHVTVFELDKGIRERLEHLYSSIKEDLRDLQNSKKHEKQYIDPFESIRSLEGRYYDGKK